MATHSTDPLAEGGDEGLVPFAKRAAVAAAIAVGMLAAVGILGYAFQVVLLTFAGVLLAILLRSLADLLSKATGLPGEFSFILVTLTIIVVVAGGAFFLATDIAEQMDQLVRQIPESINYLTERIKEYSWGDNVVRQLEDSRDRLIVEPPAQTAGDIVLGLFGGVFGVIVILFLGIYFGYNPRVYTEGIATLVPRDKRDRAREIMGHIRDTLWNWLLGVGVMIVVVGVLTSVGLWLVGMPLPVTLGIIAAMLTFIPNFGPIVGSIPGLLIAAPLGPEMVLKALAVYVIAQHVESYLVTPFVQNRMIRMPQALTILSQVFMIVLAGVLGILLAIPLLATVMVLVKELYVKDTLEEHVEEPKPLI